MPLVVMCGIPTSGKSTFARLLARAIGDAREVCIVSDDEVGESRTEMYRSSATEKRTRSILKASVQRKLTDRVVVIADSLNYIKGYRYELFCLAREVGTHLLLVYCTTTLEEAHKRDQGRRERGEDAYGDECLDALVSRFEAPREANRWERPMVLADSTGRDAEDFGVNLNDVVASVLNPKAGLRPNQATAKAAIPSTDVLQILDNVMQRVESAVLTRLPDAQEGDVVAVEPASKALVLCRVPAVAEMRRLRRAYLKLAHFHPPSSEATATEIADEYVDHLNERLAADR